MYVFRIATTDLYGGVGVEKYLCGVCAHAYVNDPDWDEDTHHEVTVVPKESPCSWCEDYIPAPKRKWWRFWFFETKEEAPMSD